MTEEEIAKLAAFHGVSESEFIQKHTRLTQDRDGLSLLENPDGTCVYLVRDNCSIQALKPQQCRDFPNLWNFPGFEKTCRAITRVVTDAEYIQLTGKRANS